MRDHFHIPFIIKLSEFASVLSNKTFPTLQFWFVIFPQFKHFILFSMHENFKKSFSQVLTDLQKLQESLGKACSLLNNVRNANHLSKKPPCLLVCDCVRLEGRSLRAYASKSKAASSETVSDRGKRNCYFLKPKWSTILNLFLCHLTTPGTSWVSMVLPALHLTIQTVKSKICYL